MEMVTAFGQVTAFGTFSEPALQHVEKCCDLTDWFRCKSQNFHIRRQKINVNLAAQMEMHL